MVFKVSEHGLVPEHKKLTKDEKKMLLRKYHATTRELPKIGRSDPAISHLNVEPGDVVKIIRKSKTAGKAAYYRVVIRG